MPGVSSTEKPHSPSGTATAKAIHDENLHEQVVVVRAGKRKSDSPLQPPSMTSVWPKKIKEAREEVTE
ncbi:Ff.00g036380.m01.CDS01 [Fusarium sp. VM40]|nr:Ff.00g036380.m01.CDS01 [Fusarium sp. VM40]